MIALQAEAIGLPILQRQVSWGSYEQTMKDVLEKLKPKGVQAEIFGDIYLQEHKDWLDRVCNESDITPVMPLWHENTEMLIGEFIDAGFEAMVVSIKSAVMGKEWLGQKLDYDFVRRLHQHTGYTPIDVCGENGEFHSLVLDGPIFKRRVMVEKGEVVETDGRLFLKLPHYQLVEK